MKFTDVTCVGIARNREATIRERAGLWLAGAVRVGEHYVHNLLEVVMAVDRLPKDTLVDGLFINDHGNDEVCWVGDEDIGGTRLFDDARYARLLQTLRPRMGGETIIHMMQCDAGKHEEMLKALARFVGVPAYGGTGLYNQVFGFSLGGYTCAMPGGSILRNAGRPRALGRGG